MINDRHGGVMRAGGQQSQSSSRVGRTRLFADQQLNQEPGAARTWGAESDETPEEGQGAHGRGPVAGGGREAELQRPVDRIGAAGFVNEATQEAHGEIDGARVGGGGFTSIRLRRSDHGAVEGGPLHDGRWENSTGGYKELRGEGDGG